MLAPSTKYDVLHASWQDPAGRNDGTGITLTRPSDPGESFNLVPFLLNVAGRDRANLGQPSGRNEWTI